MKFQRGDVVAVKPDGHWNMRCIPVCSSSIGIVLTSYEGDEPSYNVLVGMQKKWLYEDSMSMLNEHP